MTTPAIDPEEVLPTEPPTIDVSGARNDDWIKKAGGGLHKKKELRLDKEVERKTPKK